MGFYLFEIYQAMSYTKKKTESNQEPLYHLVHNVPHGGREVCDTKSRNDCQRDKKKNEA